MNQKLKRLHDVLFEGRHLYQLRDSRKALSAYLEDVEKSWWQRIKRWWVVWFRGVSFDELPHSEVAELPPYQHIKMLLLETPEDKKVELINKLVEDGNDYYLINYLTTGTMEKIRQIGEDKMWEER